MDAATPARRRALEASGCEVRFDDLTRSLYATDASIYRVMPAAVAFPRDAGEAAAVIAAAAGCGLPVTPRGAGSGLAGGALGEGVVVDLARRTRWIDRFDPEARTVRVGAGVVLDQLNAFLAPHGLWFGPDVATSSRATLGGMIANNSSGAHAPVYGTTADHVAALELVLADGTVATTGDGSAALAGIREGAERLLELHAAEISERMPPGLAKRWSGYALDRALRAAGDPLELVAGSEGTLAAVAAAELRVVPRPRRHGLGVLFFASVDEAMTATVELLDLGAAAIEHLDRLLLDQTRGQLAFAAARELLDLDRRPCGAMLLVELFDDRVEPGLAELARHRLGLRALALTDPAEQAMVWAVRKAGLNLLTARAGPAKPATGIEDVCVRPERLPEYVAGLRELLGPLGLEASFYGHAASGELHVRPVLDLHTAGGVARLRAVADGVAELTRRFQGSLAAEHGLGIARTEYLAGQLGPELAALSVEVKRLFDPRGVLNPGKVVDLGRWRVDRDLRQGPGTEIPLPFRPQTGFVDRDRGFVANLEQCNGCGGCRKDAPTMCPTFIVTGEEVMSTRGRANTIRAALEGRFDDPDGGGVLAAELAEALSSCLSCKACTRECPSNVDLAQLKANLVHARHRLEGVPLKDRVIAAADTLGRLGCLAPDLANRVLRSRLVRRMLEALLGIAAERPLPPFAAERFDCWFDRRPARGGGARGAVVLWDDTWVRYHEPGIGRAAVKVLEAAGYEVRLAEGRECCGRPAASRGLLDVVRRVGEHNLALLAGGGEPIVFLEPSCWSMFVDDYRQLGLAGAAAVAERAVLFEDLLVGLLRREPGALPLVERPLEVAIHAHCHADALGGGAGSAELAARIPGVRSRTLDTACCGMAGAFGMLRTTAALSIDVAAPLVGMVRALPQGAVLIASGTSCRHQVEDLAGRRPAHMAELLAGALDEAAAGDREPAGPGVR